MRFFVLLCSVVAALLIIVALGTRAWITMNVNEGGNVEFNYKIGLFKADFVSTAFGKEDTQTVDYTDYPEDRDIRTKNEVVIAVTLIALFCTVVLAIFGFLGRAAVASVFGIFAILCVVIGLAITGQECKDYKSVFSDKLGFEFDFKLDYSAGLFGAAGALVLIAMILIGCSRQGYTTVA